MTAAATMYTAATAAAASSTASLHLPVLRTSSSTTAGSSSLRFSGSGRLLCSSRFPSVKIRASSSEETATADTNEIFTDLKDKWDALENKSTVVLYGGGAVVAVWLSSILVGAINSVPVVSTNLNLNLLVVVKECCHESFPTNSSY
ncbi:Protein CURVATURE THYLAKOID 1A, chloroplastic [Linum grandiflorum]